MRVLHPLPLGAADDRDLLQLNHRAAKRQVHRSGFTDLHRDHLRLDGRATRAELSGSTITISSLGALGGIVSTPVINRPEVAIVAVNRIVERPVWRGGAVVGRQLMNLSSSFDHRVVDGWDAAAFIQRLKQHLEQPATLFMDPS